MSVSDAKKREDALTEFKRRIADVVKPDHDDIDLEKWLKARRYNIDHAEKMYRTSMVWRKANKADDVLDTYIVPDVLRDYYPGGMIGQDSEGRPIVIDPLGQMDFKGLLKSSSQEEIVKFCTFKAETINKLFKEKTKTSGRTVSQVIQIIDCDGFGRKHLYMPGANLFISILKVIDNNYPEMLFRTYMINAPRLFHMGYSVISSFLSEDTRNKFVFLGKDWKKELRNQLGTEEYPVHWGGKLTDPDGNVYCSSVICMGGTVPEELYQVNIQKDGKNHTKVVITHGDVHKVNIEVTEPGTFLTYNFFTEHNNLDFGVDYMTAQGGQVTVIEPIRSVPCHQFPESGNTFCEQPGIYQFKFDNKKSWMTDKTLHYHIEMSSKDTEIQNLEQNFSDLSTDL